MAIRTGPNRTGVKRFLSTVGVAAAATMVLTSCAPGASAVDSPYEQVSTPFSAATVTHFDEVVAEAMALSASPGAIVGVWAPWAGQYLSAQGVTAPGGSTEVTPDMHFRVGNTSSTMVCTVLLRLVDEGTVALSDPVQQFVENIPNIGPVTLGQLCQGTSGFGNYAGPLDSRFIMNPTREWAPLELVSGGLASTRLGEPGTVWSPSETGINLLGIALMQHTHKSWDELFRQYIFEPSGLSQTSFPSAGVTALPTPAIDGFHTVNLPEGGLDCAAPRDVSELSNSMSWVAGGVVSTADDLHHWAQTLANGSVLSEKSAEAQAATVPLGGTAPSWQGYGLGVMKQGPMLGHSGEIPGHISAMLTDPESGLTVVVMLNNSTVGANFALQLAERLASVASKLPAVEGAKTPSIELPWSEEQMAEALTAAAICQPDPEAVPAE